MIEDVMREEIRAWLARGGRHEWTPDTLFGECVRYMETAKPDDTAQLAARLLGFAEALRQKEA